jgi:4-nitrophenyl phosphatase
MHPFKPIRGFILDMDGVLWRENDAIGDLPKIFDMIANNNLSVILATNNSTRTIEQYQEKLLSFRVQLDASQVVNSSQATASLLLEKFPRGVGVYIVGEQALVETLHAEGYFFDDKNPVAVVAGMDRKFTYDKLRQATVLIRRGIPFIATNPDRTFPTPEGLVPGAGAVLAAIQAATDITPLIAGKPSTKMYELALQRMNLLAENTLVVGDRFETDIIGGQNLGCKTALVLSGVTSRSEATFLQPKPDIIAEDLTAIIQLIVEFQHGI